MLKKANEHFHNWFSFVGGNLQDERCANEELGVVISSISVTVF